MFVIGATDVRKNDSPQPRLGEAQWRMRFELKDARLFEFLVDSLAPDSFMRTIGEIRFTQSVVDIFAFKHVSDVVSHIENGWKIYDVLGEMARVGLTPENGWRLCAANTRFKLSPTYPALFSVPVDAKYETFEL
jgi:hypothetical protein